MPIVKKRSITSWCQTDFAKSESERKLDSPLALIRSRYLHELKASYMVHYEQGLVAADALLLLLQSINEALDVADEPLADWQ